MMDGSEDAPIVYFDDEGNGPIEHVCAHAGRSRARSVRSWLEHALLTGLHPEAVKAIEQMIEDLA
jgi:hypothetical protein